MYIPTEAKYKKTGIKKYDGNPLIEALPSILPMNIAAEFLAHYEDFDKSRRKAEDHTRKHELQNSLDFFTPAQIHLDLEHRISCAIRAGYVERNPLPGGYWNNVRKSISNLSLYNQYYDDNQPYSSTASRGFYMLGPSGVGKSQAIRRILDIYPQVISHTEYDGKRFTELQIVWLKVDCPFDKNTTSLSLSLLKAVDNLIGTAYFKEYENKRPSVIIEAISRVAANHHLGVLVIDEIQRLSSAKSGGHEKMLDFFVQLVNTIKLPVVLVGTVKALPLFTGVFSQGRRATGQGDMIWKRMAQDEEWEAFVESMWSYELTQRPTPKKDLKKLGKVLYEETQGITDLAVKAFRFAQELAIDIGTHEKEEFGVVKHGEKITGQIIRTAAKERFNMLRPALEALKSGDTSALEEFEDLYSKYMIEFGDMGDEGEPSNGEQPKETPREATQPSPVSEVAPLFESVDNVNNFFKERPAGAARKKSRKSSKGRSSKNQTEISPGNSVSKDGELFLSVINGVNNAEESK